MENKPTSLAPVQRLVGQTLPNCPDCAVLPGANHLPGCDVERCAACGGQRLSCGCRTRRKSLPWTGEWPGVAECREFEWYAFSPGNCTGWRRCSKDHPGATEDLNRLYVDAKWNARLGRFCLPNVEADRAGQSQPEQSKSNPTAGSASSDLLGGCAISRRNAMSDILPCPFCGQKDMGNGGIQHKIDCWIVLKFYHKNVADFVMRDAWNRRDNPPNAQVDRAGQATPDKQDQESSRLRSNDLLGGSKEKHNTTKREK